MLDFLDAFDEELDFCFMLFFGFRDFDDVLELCRVGLREREREFRHCRSDQLVEDAGREDYRVERFPVRAAERSGSERGETDRYARLRNERETEVIPDVL